mmetsp:Transcript_34555/g.87380  ORF Transcript_34555/g.87380 Transcript_34555/m.87380 type:complete len:300 (+) Transcript_34555:388-1287(+)
MNTVWLADSVRMAKVTPRKSLMWRSVRTAAGVSGPRRSSCISSGPSAHSSSSRPWWPPSTTPPRFTSSSSACAATRPTSSGTTSGSPPTSSTRPSCAAACAAALPAAPPLWDAAASAAIRQPLVVSATSVSPKPGELPLAEPDSASVKMYTSASSLLSTPRAPSTMRLVLCGETFIEYATPRMRFTMPSSVRLMRGSCFMMGTRSTTSPPPNGRAPRFTTLSSNPLSSTPSRLSRGSVTVRSTSTPGSMWSLVMPLRVMPSGRLPNRASRTRGSRNQPMLRCTPQSWTRPGPPTTMPGL